MATLSVWKFEDEAGANKGVQLLRQLQKQELIRVYDAATVTWERGKKKPKTRQLQDMTASGAMGGAFWGLLFGLIFFVPLLGLAVGVASGALAGSLADAGISDDFIRSVRSQITEGTSALFVMSSDAVQDRVVDAAREAGLKGELIHTNLSKDQEEALREAFAD